MRASVLLLIFFFYFSAQAFKGNFTQHSGYITIDASKNANIFYWMCESQNNPETDPVVMWMTGGPGCSSELALLFENGPWSINPDLTLKVNPYSWNNNANVLYIDQPVGTGFSYANSDYIHNEAEVAIEMWAFLQGFLAKFPQYQKQDFYVIGESYAGHYVPTVGLKIVQENAAGVGIKVNLKAIGIGNGWVDPYIQYGAYGPFAYENKLIRESTYVSMNNTYATCKKLIENKQWDKASDVCSGIMQAVLNDAGNINVYNIKLPCLGPLCYNFTDLNEYMNQLSVKKALGVNTSIIWETCNYDVAGGFGLDSIQSFQYEVPYILANDVRVYVYSGDLDLICNYVGGWEWVSEMNWPGKDAFNRATPVQWSVDGSPAGIVTSAQNLAFIRVFEAGHMVPHDQGKNALALLNHILSNTPFK
eukprot:TRINITY_DN1302_c0_g1_i1.p1 TRINITY_DN1302_c0_g1~~TRINITY_DN1302_c0_g1_i1.p1  ORF type:complete len:419 (-),score=58.78 TRINITY_DN1302_c0_g1_i1:11-1267(-)